MTFREIAEGMIALQEKKNADYGNAFEMSCDKYGIVAALTRMGDKMNRIESLYRKGDALIKEERIEDTLIDLAAYALMTIEWLHKMDK